MTTKKEMEISAKFNQSIVPLNADFKTVDVNIKTEFDLGNAIGTSDYRKLKHLPSINGTTLIENYDEIDPTVPTWAKTTHKPEYDASEIDAVPANNTISFAEIDEMFNLIFSK